MCAKDIHTVHFVVFAVVIFGSYNAIICSPLPDTNELVTPLRIIDRIVYGPELPSSVIEGLQRLSVDEFLVEAARQRPADEIFLIDGLTDERVSVGEYLDKSFTLAAKLQELGSKTGTVVAISSDNRLEYPVVALATLLTGATFTGFGPGRSIHELRGLCDIAQPNYIFCSTDDCHIIKELAPATAKIIVFDAELAPAHALPYERYSQFIQTSHRFMNVEKAQDDIAFLLYTGGTSGLVKASMCTHANFVFGMHNLMRYRIEKTGPMTMPVYSMGYIMGLNSVFSALTRRETAVIIPTAGDQANELLLSTVQKYEVNRIFLLAGTVLFLLRSPLVENYNLSSLDFISWGGGPLSSDIEDAVRDRLGLRYVQQMYGLTELSSTVLVKHPTSKKRNTCGSPIPGMRLKVVNLETKTNLGPQEWGELLIQGPLVMKGYLNNVVASSEVIDEAGWLHTGDVAYYDEDGDFYIVDRVKELIKTDGHQVWPAELENFLRQHPAVSDVAVIGIPDEEHIEVPRAYVVKHDGVEVTENELIEHIESIVNLDYKKLRGGVEFVTEIPKNSINKVLRRKLRERWEECNNVQ